jgi:CRISPR/Cas system CSM-associated protein Csm5 (group 7 of RAMP superfamily)
MKRYKIKATALSPIHIGTGEAYEPTSYVIDDGFLYSFKEDEFIKNLNKQEINELSKLTFLPNIYKFFKDRKEIALEIYEYSVEVSKEIENIYKYIEFPRRNPKTKQIQKNKFGKPVYNKMEILKTLKNPNTSEAVISGSSLKGAIESFLDLNSEEKRKLKISDTNEIKENELEIGFSQRLYKNSSKNTKKGIAPIVEIIKKNSQFEFFIDFEDIETIKTLSQKFYESRNREMFNQFSYHLNKNSFLLRIGRFVGQEFMVKNLKKPPKTMSVYKQNKYDKNYQYFGWLLCEIVEEKKI